MAKFNANVCCFSPYFIKNYFKLFLKSLSLLQQNIQPISNIFYKNWTCKKGQNTLYLVPN
ncbi:hypothetical protein MNB_SUP05-SYMBIONT-5-1008 [hydrothermal vent metagenome]|uniref:Uncharacterized protein n=1 Tax=hydrothermal vent metagenome TaxID=652676 RepID=A0A1W1E1T2_9ZZZZ